ncbi:MAG TPA: hypothetical protein VGP79_19095 [Bryobacteraceae bacterium]|nr:hypothetical protein [Bryobacteraceae bacterium]
MLLLLCAALASAATTTTWEMNSYQDFLRGKLNGLSLTQDGRLIVGPRVTTLFSSDQPQIWSVAQAPDGSLYLGTGHRGRLYKLDPQGKSTLAWTADQPEIFAVAVDAKGVVYAATSPDGKVYRIENGKAAEYFAPEARYIWALQVAPDGALMVATGDQGRIFRVTGAGKGALFYDSGQSHVTCLAFDRAGNLLAGSEPNGILYRIAPSGRAFVLYDANLPEIHAIVPAPDGTIYAAALGGSVSRRTSGTGSQATPAGAGTAPTISVTVTDAAQAGLNAPPRPTTTKASDATQPTAVSTPTTADVSGVEKSAIYRIHADNTVETIWSSKEENAYDLVLDRDVVTFATDAQARIYRLERDRKATLIAQTNEGAAMRLVALSSGLVATTGDAGKVLRLVNGTGASGTFESPVHDAGTVARWGRLIWRMDGKGIVFRTRSGNTARPDATWSDWSEPITETERAAIASPNARYVQWRAEFAGTAAGAALDSVTIAYVPQNTPPVVRSISVTSQGASASAGKTQSAVGATPPSYSITVTDTGEAATPAGAPSQTLSRAQGSQVQISWQADDPDGDRLIYSLYFRGDEEREWKLLRGNITENTYLLDADLFADGRYFFRVTASDRLSNPLNLAREADLVSAPVIIDSTPPTVTAGAPRRSGATVEIDVDAEDRGNILRRCEFSVDAGQWYPVEASDGVTDSAKERFLVRVENLPAGEHLIVIRVYDAAGNAGLTKVVVR